MELYTRFSPRMLGIVLTVMGDRHAAEDIVQDAMLELWDRSAARYDPALGTAASWILRLARSRAIDHTRRVGRRSTLIEKNAEVLTRRAPDTDRPHALESEALRSVLSNLPEEERLPVVLAYAYGLSREEIAEHTGAPVGTVKTRIRRAVARLREHMSPAEVTPAS